MPPYVKGYYSSFFSFHKSIKFNSRIRPVRNNNKTNNNETVGWWCSG